MGERGGQGGGVETDFDFNLGLRNILLTATSAGNSLRLGELSTYSLRTKVLQREGFDGVDTQLGVWLDDCKASGYCILYNALVNGMGADWRVYRWGSSLTEELLAAGALLDDIDYTGSELLNRRDMVGKNTHVTGFGGDVDLNAVT